jgi:membrane protease YdiL (CAAX protease family)
MLILEGRHKTRKDVFWSIVYSSLIFGGIHIVNLFAGSSIVPVIQQLGYSFLIGAMCAVALIITRNIWMSVMLHATFNFAGGLIPTLGSGNIWDTATIIITAVLAVIVTVYMVMLFLRIDLSHIDEFFTKNKKGSA